MQTFDLKPIHQHAVPAALEKAAWYRALHEPLEAESICPDVMVTLDNAGVRALPVYFGKRQCRIDDFFTVDGEKSDEIDVHGDLKKVRWIGRGMTRGRISIDGNAGMHLGAYMKGGAIEVSGAASDWVGGEMSGGSIRVGGNAGGQIESLGFPFTHVTQREGPRHHRLSLQCRLLV